MVAPKGLMKVRSVVLAVSVNIVTQYNHITRRTLVISYSVGLCTVNFLEGYIYTAGSAFFLE
jgi:hypothetical protein